MRVPDLRGMWSSSVLVAILALPCASAIFVYLQHRDLNTLNAHGALILDQISTQAAKADIRLTFSKEPAAHEAVAAVGAARAERVR